MTKKRINITSLFETCGMDTGHTEIIETGKMYPYKEKVEENWAYFTAVGFQRLKKIFDNENKKIENVGIVGIGSGVEGIAAIHIFKNSLKQLIITDIDNGILEGAVANLADTAKQEGAQIVPLIGSFCEPIEKSGYLVDFVHANVPNLPAKKTDDLRKGAEKGTFLSEKLYDKYNPPKKFVSWAMGAQYAYLISAKKVIPQGGTVITEFGGRVPMQLVRELFNECDLKLQEVITGFKEQTEALIDFIGYHKMEKKYGVAFEFYKYSESLKLLNKKSIKNPTHEIDAEEMKNILEPYKITAGEAIDLYHKKISVGHTVHLLRGIKN